MNNNFNNNNPNKPNNYQGHNFTNRNSNQGPNFHNHDNNYANNVNSMNSEYIENDYQLNNQQAPIDYDQINRFSYQGHYDNNQNYYNNNDSYNQYNENDFSRFSYNNNNQQENFYNTNGNQSFVSYDNNVNRTPIINKDPLDYVKKNGMSGIDYYGSIPDEKRYDMYLYTLAELNEMEISVENTTKKFYMGKMYYKLTDEYLNYLSKIQNGDYTNQENTLTSHGKELDNNLTKKEQEIDYELNFDNPVKSNENLSNQELEKSNLVSKKEKVNKNTNNYENNIDEDEDEDEELNNLVIEDDVEFDQKLLTGPDIQLDENIYLNEDEINGTTNVDGDIPENDSSNLENLINDHTQILLNQNKNLDTDLEYKIYSLSFNKNEKRKDLGKLDNITFDIYPKDRIMVLGSDKSKTSTTLIDVLSRRHEKQSGYVYFNIKRKQKWVDMYSKEFKQYDLDMVNKKSDVLYQLESPDYFSYGSEKKDTPLSLFKKVFYAIDVLVSESLFYKLIEIFDFKPLIKKHISQLSDTEKRIFVLICDILIGKHVLIIPLTEFKLEINKKIEFFSLLNNMNKNKSTIIIFSSWDILDAKIFANRVLCLDEGKMILDKKINDILKIHNSLDKFLLDYLQTNNRNKRRQELLKKDDDDDDEVIYED